MASRQVLPHVSPCVLFTRIVPQLKKKGWQITRGRGLEEGDRIYLPGCKAKGVQAVNNQDFFLCYDEYDANKLLVDYVFDNEILLPEQVWMPHELHDSTQPTPQPTELGNVDTPQSKKKRIEVTRTNSKKKTVRKETFGHDEGRTVKRQKKAQHQNSRVDMKYSTSETRSTVKAEMDVENEGRKCTADECGMRLLRDLKLRMLDFATLANRRCREFRDAANGQTPASKTEELAGVVADIENSQKDLNCEVVDVIGWIRSISPLSTLMEHPSVQLPRFEGDRDGMKMLLSDIKLFMQQLVVVVRRYRRSICSVGVETTTQSRPHGFGGRSTEYESLASDIGLLQDDLNGGISELVALTEMHPTEISGTEDTNENEETDTDDDE